MILPQFMSRNKKLARIDLGGSRRLIARHSAPIGQTSDELSVNRVNIAVVTIFVTFAAAALVCVVLGAHRRVVLGLRVDRAATRQLLGAAHSRTMA
jgi:hypothetical protein